MSFMSEALGKIAATLREESDGLASWTYHIEVALTPEQAQALTNIVHTVGDVQIKKVSPNKFVFTLLATNPAEEAATLKRIVDRFVHVMDREVRQRRETPLAVNSTVPIHGHHNQD